MNKRAWILKGTILLAGVWCTAVGLYWLFDLEHLWAGLFFLCLGIVIIAIETIWPSDRTEKLLARDDLSEEEGEALMERYRRAGSRLMANAIWVIVVMVLLATAYFFGMIPELLFKVAVPIALAAYILRTTIIVKLT